ncbi:hypothetical protein ACVCAH_10440 [Micromonospora sp. LZ34]
MSGRQKALLAALGVLLVVLFAVAVAAGRGDRGDPGTRSGLVERLGRFGGEQAAVDPATVAADCAVETGRLVFSGGCALRIADPGGLRTLVLRSPATFSIEAPAPGDVDVTVRDDVEPAADGSGAVVRVAVDRPTAVLLRCPGLGTCTVTVAPS